MDSRGSEGAAECGRGSGDDRTVEAASASPHRRLGEASRDSRESALCGCGAWNGGGRRRRGVRPGCGRLELDSDKIWFAYFGPHWASRLCWSAYPGWMKNGMQNGISRSKTGFRKYGRTNAPPFSVLLPFNTVPFSVLFPFFLEKNKNRRENTVYGCG